MKTLQEYFDLQYPYELKMLTEEEGGGFFIRYTDLPGCMSDGETADEAIKMGEDARQCWIESRLEQGKSIPLPFSASNKYNGRITVRAPKSLHRELIEKAENEGISLNQYLVYLLSKGVNSDIDLRK